MMKKSAQYFLSIVLRQIALFVGRTIYRLKPMGTSHIPTSGGALLVANHASYMDFLLILCSINRPVRFVMNADVFNKPVLKWIFSALHCIPIAPRGGKNNFEDFNAAVSEQVNNGNLVVIFAEGTVSRTGQILEFKKGVEHLSTLIRGPIIPIHFHNVQGSPFTYRGGKNELVKFRPSSLRKEVLVNIGKPIIGPVKAFLLRQKIKELEIENVERQVMNMQNIDRLIDSRISARCKGFWRDNEDSMNFGVLNQEFRKLDLSILPVIHGEKRIAILLPNNCKSKLICLWLIRNKKSIVPIDPSTTNEERLFICNRAKIQTMITTMDLNFTTYTPNAKQVIYIEDIEHSILSRNPVLSAMDFACKRVKNWFYANSEPNHEVALIFEKTQQDELRCFSISQKNVLAALLAIRQIYYFEKGTSMLSDLHLFDAYGLMFELLIPIIHDLKTDITGGTTSVEKFNNKLLTSKPNLVLCRPSTMESLAAISQIKNLPFLTTVFTADMHPDHHAIQTLMSRQIDVLVGAGLNATSSLFAVNLHNYHGKDIVGKPLEQENRMDSSIGKAIPGMAVKVCTPTDPTTELPANEMGTLWLKGPMVAADCNNDHLNKIKTIHGWIDSGLRGSIDSKGFIYLH